MLASGYVVSLVLQAPLYLFSPAPEPYDVLSVAARPDLLKLGEWVQRAAGTVVVLAAAVVLGRRFAASSAWQRRVLGDPSLQLLFWLPDHGVYADLDGRQVDLPPAGTGSATVPIEIDRLVVAEALANAVKHLQAEALRVRVTRADDERGGRLHVDVDDGGIGGADVAGSGLRGLADRVSVLGGRLVVDSPIGRGTRLRAELPCAS
ncbi:MAG: ATP-binding protein [Ilumatobacteraceae bacterium]